MFLKKLLRKLIGPFSFEDGSLLKQVQKDYFQYTENKRSLDIGFDSYPTKTYLFVIEKNPHWNDVNATPLTSNEKERVRLRLFEYCKEMDLKADLLEVESLLEWEKIGTQAIINANPK